MSFAQGFQHPCLSCGACCARYRVSFYWREEVPLELREDLNVHYSCMKGTNSSVPRCVALTGVLGKEFACSIYNNRPTPCREFEASYETGVQNDRCDESRKRIGLRPLTPSDFLHL